MDNFSYLLPRGGTLGCTTRSVPPTDGPLYAQAKYPVFDLLGKTDLNFGKVVVKQATDILGKE